MGASPSAEVVLKTFRKIVAALQGVGHPPVVIGDLAHQAWGSKREPAGVRLLVPSGPQNRDAILGAARGEGLQQKQGPEPLQFTHTDAKSGTTAEVLLVEAATRFQRQVIARAQRAPVLDVMLPLASCDDVILLGIASELPADRDGVIELLKANAGRIDAAYLKREAEAAGTFDRLKSAWQEARK
jgi:hypothetical protein